MHTETAPPPWQRLGHQLKLGLRSRAEADWLPSGDLFGDTNLRARQIALKQTLSDARHRDIFAALPGSEPAGHEVYEMVRDHLTAHHPGTVAPPASPDPALHPLDAAARLVPEDLLVLEARHHATADTITGSSAGSSADSSAAGPETLWHLLAGALAFPAHWVLRDKMGLPLAAIHEPVPHYGARLERPMDKFFNAMQVGPISARMNWSLQADEDYYAPHRKDRVPLAVGDVETRLFLRVENQTLRKLPKTGAILFTIRTHMVPFQRWRDAPDAIADLLTMCGEMSAATYAYKGIHLYEAALRDWYAHITA